MTRILRYAAFAILVFALMGFAGMLIPMEQPALPPSRATANPNVQPIIIAPSMLLAIQSLPSDLTKAIDAAAQSPYEIIAVTHSGKFPLEPMAPPISEVWCITLHPEATLTLYVQRYVAPKDALVVKAGDYVPGEARTGTIDHFLAVLRGQRWELYHPDVYPWKGLGC